MNYPCHEAGKIKRTLEMSLKQNQAIVKSLAKEFRGKTSILNCFDANVCRSHFLPTRPWETKYIPGDLFETEARFRRGNHQFRAMANREFVYLALRLENLVRSPVFAVNRPDRVMLLKTLVKQTKQLPNQVYASDKSSAKTAGTWLSDPANLECLQSFSLGENDSLHVYRNELRLYLWQPSQDRIVAMLTRLEMLVAHLQLESEDVLDFCTLPEQFQKLKPLMEKWAVSDDHERSILVEQASRQALKKLVRAVSPQMDAINEFLDSFRDKPLSDAAILLGTLAECATEANLRLDKSEENSNVA